MLLRKLDYPTRLEERCAFLLENVCIDNIKLPSCSRKHVYVTNVNVLSRSSSETVLKGGD